MYCGREHYFHTLKLLFKNIYQSFSFCFLPFSTSKANVSPSISSSLACVCVSLIFGCRDSAGSRAHDDITTPLFQCTSGNAQVSERERTARTWGKSTNDLGISAPPPRIGKGWESKKRERNGRGLLERNSVWIMGRFDLLFKFWTPPEEVKSKMLKGVETALIVHIIQRYLILIGRS